MSNWFECKVKYDKTLETGLQKTASESYLVEADSFTEAEANIIEQISPFATLGPLQVTAVRRMNLSEIFYHDGGDRWYKVKTNFITIDEKTAAEKRTASFSLAQAKDFKEALEVYVEGMKGTMQDFEIASITETALMDVFPLDYSKNEADKKAEEKSE